MAMLLCAALLIFIPFLGSVHLFDWDEINFAESAREMIVSHNYSRVQVNFQPFWEKPPLFFWLQSICMHLFGINEFAARLPNAITGVLTILTFYQIGTYLYNEKFGLIWALSYLGSLSPQLYFKSGIIDPVFNYFIFLTIYFIAKSISVTNRTTAFYNAAIAGVTIGLATLTKGPVGFLIVSIAIFVYWASIRFSKISSFKNILAFLTCFLLVSFLWFGWETIKNGPWFLLEFIKYQIALFLTPVAGHGEPVYYHFLVVFFGCFPISILAIPVLLKNKISYPMDRLSFKKWMLILFWVVMILFSIVKTKIVHYSSLSYFPLSYLASLFIYNYIEGRVELKKYISWLFIITAFLLTAAITLLPILAQNKELLIPYLKDPFAVACLNANVQWHGWEFTIGIIYLLVLISALLALRYKRSLNAVIYMFLGSAICIFFSAAVLVPKIEGYSQAPAINFYKSLASKNVYVSTIGFKSYAPYYYFQKMPGNKSQSSDERWLLKGPIDKPAYMVAKITNKSMFDTLTDIRLLGQSGGFLFYRRMPAAEKDSTKFANQ